ncbi:MAG: peroxidase [Acidimicrobiia bacterium]|nr:peroxidase [Acidimicrobiia bacterium]
MTTHGATPLRGLESAGQSSITTGKFGRMFRWLPPAFEPGNNTEDEAVTNLLTELAGLMISNEFNDNVDEKNHGTPDSDIQTPEEADENRTIPAGYTYLGQFIDHDITFDPASSLQQQNDPDALEDFRTPRLDLDSVYGRGPDDQPYLYDRTKDRKQFLLPAQSQGINGQIRPDLPRNGDATALIGDKRNDENKIVRQIHALFLRFHNKVFEELAARPDAGTPQQTFNEAQRIVRWCYQYIVLHDFLPRVCLDSVVHDILPPTGHREPRFEFYRPHDGDAFIPVEFAAAAYRFGHSMVRPSYALNDTAHSGARFHSKGGKDVGFARIPIFVGQSSANTDAMNGFGEPLPADWGIDWNFFFGDIPHNPVAGKQIPQPSYRIDATLVDPLGKLPEFVPAFAAGSPFASLAFRNLQRGFRMGLPSGQAVARMMQVPVLGEKDLWETKFDGDTANPWTEGQMFLAKHHRWLEGRAPLWFYILKEAEVLEKGHRLGPVGSRIVAETIIGLVWYDHFSYLFQIPGWNPSDERIAGLTHNLDMASLTAYVG